MPDAIKRGLTTKTLRHKVIQFCVLESLWLIAVILSKLSVAETRNHRGQLEPVHRLCQVNLVTFG
jgi:hypothetical protein